MVRNRPSVDPFTSNRRGASTAAPMRRNAQSESYEGGPESPELPAGADSFSSGREEAVKGVSDSGPAEVTVEKKEGHFEVKGNMNMAVEPDVTYGILTDYENNPKIFKTVSKVEVEHRDDSKLVTQHAHWNLLFWSGGFDMKMKVLEDHSKRAISYKLSEPGFLTKFNGYWGVEPWVVEGKPMGSRVVVIQEVLPSLLPPGPLAGIVGRIMGNQVKAVLQDLLAEAEKVQQRGIDKSSDSMPSFEQ
ncbi:unnamed protein product [Sphagnum jensenii]|uniref:Uncharacterized protein n=2 Tax=Sphagnum jensenii TaxID=128206 RepID=A0ABP0VY74_9BRYO